MQLLASDGHIEKPRRYRGRLVSLNNKAVNQRQSSRFCDSPPIVVGEQVIKGNKGSRERKRTASFCVDVLENPNTEYTNFRADCFFGEQTLFPERDGALARQDAF